MKDKVFFPGLNGIRAIAALIVLIFHIDQNLHRFGFNSFGFHKTGMAGYGVILFFVLSGYLITYLLLLEKEEFQKVDLPKFYTRRILRIWPIYYLAILITLIFILNTDYKQEEIAKTFILYSLLLSNVGYGLGLGISSITPLWSIGVEEQFYASWPLMLNNSKNILKTLLILILIYLLIKLGLRIFENGTLYNILSISSFDCMALGGIGAYFVFTKNKYLKFIYNPIIQITAWAILIFTIFNGPLHIFTFIDKEINALFYIIIIVNVSTNKNTLINLENRIFDFLGKISYGIYVWHMIVILILSYFLKDLLNFENSVFSYIVIFLSVIFSAILFAFLSYKYFESFFLRLKHMFTKVESVSSRPKDY